ncbi:MAG: hypothetical protein QW327_02945 [Candidatus Odinarchaeota archaeon]
MSIMSLEYEIETLFEKVRRCLNLQKSIVLRGFMSNYLPAVSVSINPEDSDDAEDNIVDSLYFNDLFRPGDIVGSAS